MKSIIKYCIFLILFMAAGFFSKAQYYYQDIHSNRELLSEVAKLKEQKIRTISVKSFEDDGSESEGFFLEKKIAKNYLSMETFSRSYMSTASVLTTRFNKSGLLENTTDSSESVVRSSAYTYNENKQMVSVLSSIRSSDDDFVTEILEEHIYLYNEKGVLHKMQKIKNRLDTTEIFFSTDEKNNVTIEKDSKTGSKYYYYYDSRNRLTEIAHSNDFMQGIYPDYQFEYNGAGLLTQMINTEEGANKYYFVWKYTYSDGLRTSEKCYSKEHRLMGTIQYEYK